MEYKIIRVHSSEGICNTILNELEKLVNEEMKEGWEPQGGVAIKARPQGAYRYAQVCQAMIRR
jgi:hypothetical protein